MTGHPFKPSPCPVCHLTLDMTVAYDGDDRGRGPQPGDASLCAHCNAWLVFDDDMQLQVAPPEVVERIEERKENRRAKQLGQMAAYMRSMRNGH